MNSGWASSSGNTLGSGARPAVKRWKLAASTPGGGLGLQAGQAAVEGRIGAGDQWQQYQQPRQDAPGRRHGAVAGVWTDVMRWSAPVESTASDACQMLMLRVDAGVSNWLAWRTR
ncbi:hypothetical protein ACFQS6_24395 [Xanthomonas populi]